MRLDTSIPVLGFVAASGTGKTTLLTQLITSLHALQLRVGLIKHSHHDFEVDYPGKDSYRLRHAGASSVLLVSPFRRVIIDEFTAHTEPDFATQLALMEQRPLDLILVEGFKHAPIPKIELHRDELQHPFYFPHDPQIIAVASNSHLELPAQVRLLNLDQPDTCLQFILHWAQLTPHAITPVPKL